MKIKIISTVNATFQRVSKGFNEKLFKSLLPPSYFVKLLRYDGEQPGSIIHLRFLLPWKSDWVSRITDSKKTNDEYYFIDVGDNLPYGLKQWSHRHIVKQLTPSKTAIVDEIDFSTGNKIFDVMVYPLLLIAFLPRKRSYRKFFEIRKSGQSWQQKNQWRVIITY